MTSQYDGFLGCSAPTARPYPRLPLPNGPRLRSFPPDGNETEALDGRYAAAEAKAAGGEGGTAVSVASFEVSGIAEKLISAIPIWGILLVVASDDVVVR